MEQIGTCLNLHISTQHLCAKSGTSPFVPMFEATDKLKIGGSITGTIDPRTKEHLQNQGFVGIKIGDSTIGWDNLPQNKDFSVEFSLGAYLGVGGEVSFKINLSELVQKIFK